MSTQFFWVSLLLAFISLVDSYPVCDPSTPSLRPEYPETCNELPTIISFGPIYIGSLKGGITSEKISLHPTEGTKRPEETNPTVIFVANCKKKHIAEEPEKLDPYNAQSDYYEYAAGQHLPSPQLHFIQSLDIHREKDHEREIKKQLEILNQLAHLSESNDVEEPEIPQRPTIHTPDTEYPKIDKPSGPLTPEASAELMHTPLGDPFQNYAAVVPQVTETKVSPPGDHVEDAQTGPTSASFAQALSKYIQNTTPLSSTMSYPCDYPKDSVYVSKKQEALMRQFAREFGEHVQEILDEVERYKEMSKEAEDAPAISGRGKIGFSLGGFLSGGFKHKHLINVGHKPKVY